MNPRLIAARSYAARGWAVVPLHTPTSAGCSCSRGARCPTPGKHPRLATWKAYQQTPPTAEEITEWFQRWPDANVGILTGVISQLAVLDVDARSGGLETLHELDARGLWMPDDNPLVATGGGGLHHYVGLDHALAKCAPFAGIELQADGALVVAPPSQHHSRRPYIWLREPQPGALPAMPAWLRRCALKVLGPTPAPIRRHAPVPSQTDDVLEAVQAAGLYLRPHRRDRWHYIVCPWADTHSNADAEALLIAPGAVGSEGGWGFCCLHAHCADRHLGALLDYLKIPRRRP